MLYISILYQDIIDFKYHKFEHKQQTKLLINTLKIDYRICI